MNRAQYTYDKAPSDVGLGPTGFHPWRGFASFNIVVLRTPQDAAALFRVLIPARETSAKVTLVLECDSTVLTAGVNRDEPAKFCRSDDTQGFWAQ